MTVSSDIVSRTMRRIRNKTVKAFEEGAHALANAYYDDVSVPWPPSSKPGEHPHVRTGRGRDAIYSEVIDTGDLRSVTAEVKLAPEGIHLHYLTSDYWGRLGMEDSFFKHYNEILTVIKREIDK